MTAARCRGNSFRHRSTSSPPITTKATNKTCAATTSVASTCAVGGLIAPDPTRSGRRRRSLPGCCGWRWDDEPGDEIGHDAKHDGAGDDGENDPCDANNGRVDVEVFGKTAADAGDSSVGMRTHQ